MEYTPQTVNLHIRAKDEETLQLLQYANNLANMRVYNYQTPYESKDGDIVVWFYGDITTWIRVDESTLTQDFSAFKSKDIGALVQANSKLGAKE